MTTRFRGRFRVLSALALGVAAAAVLAACESGAYPLDVFPEMHYQQSFRPGEPPLVTSPEGNVPTTGREVVLDFGAASQLANPVEANLDSISAGGKLFRNNCSMCHGFAADGDSPVALRFANAGVRPPPNLLEGVAKVSPDGFIFAVMTHGIGNMPSFQPLLRPEERWTIVNYLRSIQAAAALGG